MRLPQRSSKAFTLIELIVVIVILGILALIAIPTFGKVISKSQDESTLSTLRSIARDAQALRALDQGTTWGTSPADAIGETTQASAAGTTAGGALTALLDAGVDPVAGQVAYRVSGDGVVFAMRSASQRICVLGASLTVTSAGSCVTPAAGASTNPAAPAAQSTLAGAVQSDTSLAPGWIFTPNAPRNVTATAGPASATLSWAAPTANGSTVTGYKIVASTGQTATAKATDTTAVVSGLTPGTSVTFTIVATSGSGDGATASSNSITAGALVAAASTFTAKANGGSANGAVLSWVKSPDASVTKYRISATPAITPVEVGNVTSASITGLSPEVVYTFKVEPLAGTTVGTATTTNFTYYNSTSSTKTFVVPAGVSSLSTYASGGIGSGQTVGISLAGRIPVTPAANVYVTVGGNGGGHGTANTSFYGGYNGGAYSGDGYFSGGGGGGATDVRLGGTGLGDRVLVAPGTGGAGGTNYSDYSAISRSNGTLLSGSRGLSSSGGFGGGGGGGGYYGGLGGDNSSSGTNSGSAGTWYVRGDVTSPALGSSSLPVLSFNW